MTIENNQLAVLLEYIGCQKFNLGDFEKREFQLEEKYGFFVSFEVTREREVSEDTGTAYAPPCGTLEKETDTITELAVYFDDELVELTKNQETLLICHLKGSLV